MLPKMTPEEINAVINYLNNRYAAENEKVKIWEAKRQYCKTLADHEKVNGEIKESWCIKMYLNTELGKLHLAENRSIKEKL